MWKPTASSDELYHHGIMGQRWGDRNGPPYPLGSGDHSSEEKKRGWKQSLDAKDTKKRKKQLAKMYKDERRQQRKREKEKKHNDKKEYKAYSKAYRKATRDLKRDKDYQEALANYIINSRKRVDAVNSRSKEWGTNEDYYQYKDRRRNEWALSKEGAADRKEAKALRQRGEAIVRKRLGRSYDESYNGTKARGERVLDTVRDFTNYFPEDYKYNKRYMSNKTRRKITRNK